MPFPDSGSNTRDPEPLSDGQHLPAGPGSLVPSVLTTQQVCTQGAREAGRCTHLHTPVCGVGGVGREEGQAGEGSSIWTLDPWPVIGPSSCQELLEVVRAVFTPPAPSPCPQVPWSSLGHPVRPSRPSLRIPHCSSKLLGGFAAMCMTPTGTALSQILASRAEADVG